METDGGIANPMYTNLNQTTKIQADNENASIGMPVTEAADANGNKSPLPLASY